MRQALARWLQALALRLDPYDPFEGLIDASVHRALDSRWAVIAVFHTYGQADAARGHLLSLIHPPKE